MPSHCSEDGEDDDDDDDNNNSQLDDAQKFSTHSLLL
jgi:hypothetical protein